MVNMKTHFANFAFIFGADCLKILLKFTYRYVYAYDYVNWHKHNSYIHQDHTCNSVDIPNKREMEDAFDEDTLSFQFNSIRTEYTHIRHDTFMQHMIWLSGFPVSYSVSLYINRCSYSLHKFIEFLRAGENAFARKMINKKREIYTRELNMQHMAGVMLLFGHFCSFTFQIMGFLAEMLKSGSHTSRQHIQMSHTKYQTNTKK